MQGKKLFLILDIDGVLLESHGYRLSCIDTINSFLWQMGQPVLSVDREIADVLESSGIAAEWDMVPLTLAAFVNWYCEQSGVIPSGSAFPPDCSKMKLTDQAAFRCMLKKQAIEYGRLLDPADNCIHAIYTAYLEGRGKGLEHLWQLPFRDQFFEDTLDPWKCPFFAELMNRILGTETFESFYGMKAPLTCESYLETKDTLLITEKNRILLPEIAGKTVFPAVMTYRPTKIPETAGNTGSSYFVNTPEGECALRLLGWNDGRIGMIGGGDLCYIEEKYGLRREYYVKPHPFHALAVMMMAVCGDEITALETARKLCENDPQAERSPASDWLSGSEKIYLAVFEDSVSGVRSVRNAVRVLRSWGYDSEEILCGIRTTDAKNQALLREGAMLFDDFDQAFEETMQKYGENFPTGS